MGAPGQQLRPGGSTEREGQCPGSRVDSGSIAAGFLLNRDKGGSGPRVGIVRGGAFIWNPDSELWG